LAEAVAQRGEGVVGFGREGGFASVVFVFLHSDGAHGVLCKDGGGDAGAHAPAGVEAYGSLAGGEDWVSALMQ